MNFFSVDSHGVISVDSSSILAAFQNLYQTIFGADVSLDASSPQGQLITADTTDLITAQTQAMQVINSFNPYSAVGAELDTVGAFFGYFRKTNAPTIVIVTCTGATGTVIPAGSLVSDGTNQYQSLNQLTIAENGIVNGQFAGVTPGAILCYAGSINTIVNMIPGWDTATNLSDGIVGFDVESDPEFRGRIVSNFMTIHARAILGAIIDNIAQLPGVRSVVGRENPTQNNMTIDGVVLPPHSVYLAIVGGATSDIGGAICKNKTIGADTVGNTIVTFFEPISQYNYIYNIQRPDEVRLHVAVQYQENQFTLTDSETTAIDMIMDWIANNPLQIGQTISGNMLAASLANFAQMNILSFKVGVVGSSAGVGDFVTNTISQYPILSRENITMTKV